ncbi:MAG: rod shape-determining protein RodA [Desulfomonile tiedjei]|uniref:Peptidoglycan glycosyltransferase RodA n=1 Tax=Desulfomonile tiedjei TaxID=2358 RepID=A0A9D6V010_9BACT|nr:rod shape-determining protein RodA [Desulfomonile tiedjei]
MKLPLIFLSMVLSGIGLALIFSATAPMGEAGRSFVIRQMTWCSLGLVLMAVFLLFDYRILERWALWIYIIVVAALIAVWAVGKVTAGSRRWIEIGMMRFQPSEFAKLAVVIILAKCFQNGAGKAGYRWIEVAQGLMLAAVPMVLVLIQPDLGTAGVIFIIAVSVILFAVADKRILVWAGGVVLGLIPILLLVGDRLLLDYQRKRILTFLNPDSDPLGAGYHILQSQIAIGSGGILGKGFLKGTQNQLMFLPVKHTDFIFSILAEEWGFVGSFAVLLLFTIMFFMGLGVAGKARDSFGAILAFGCTAVLFWHVVINVAMVMGLLPVVGVPLIFLSYGGSSLLASFLAIAILVNVSMRRFSY